MNCSHCQKNISDKSWLHLSNLPSTNGEGKILNIDKHICSYSCYKKLYDKNLIPKKFNMNIVNKEDYQYLIRPVTLTQKEKKFEYLTFNEINLLSDQEKEKYFFERSQQIHINPIMEEIHNEMNFEDQKTAYLESFSSEDEVIYDDY